MPTYPTSCWNQLICLLWRSLMTYVRNPADVIGRLLMSLSIGILVGITFINSNAGKLLVLWRSPVTQCDAALPLSDVFVETFNRPLMSRVLLFLCSRYAVPCCFRRYSGSFFYASLRLHMGKSGTRHVYGCACNITAAIVIGLLRCQSPYNRCTTGLDSESRPSFPRVTCRGSGSGASHVSPLFRSVGNNANAICTNEPLCCRSPLLLGRCCCQPVQVLPWPQCFLCFHS